MPTNYFVQGHDVLYKKPRHNCLQDMTVSVMVQGMKRDRETLAMGIMKKWLKMKV
jgi:hypothetical protein